MRRQVLQMIGREDVVGSLDPKVLSFPDHSNLGFMRTLPDIVLVLSGLEVRDHFANRAVPKRGT